MRKIKNQVETKRIYSNSYEDFSKYYNKVNKKKAEIKKIMI
jgi:hypothetical protein